MSFGISLKIDSVRAQRKIHQLINLIDPIELLHAIGNRHVTWMVQNLRQAGLDEPHQQMAESTIAARPKRSSPRHFSSRWRSRLQQSFVHKVLNKTTVEAGTEDQFAPHHHFGTKPTIIRPKTKKYLKFAMPSGAIYTTKPIHHPGIPARALLPTKKTAEVLAHGILDAAIRKKAREFGV